MTVARAVIVVMCRAQNWINTQPLERPARAILKVARSVERKAWWTCRRVATFARTMETKL